MRKVKFEIPVSVQEELNARDEKQEKESEKLLDNGIFQLSFPWSNEKRGVPNSLLRSALFGVVRRGRRELLDGVEIASWGSTTIKFTGKKLQQSDQDLWMACVEACKRSGKTEVEVGQREFMRLIGRKNGNSKQLWDDLRRLVFAGIEVKSERYSYAGTLIHNAVKDEESGRILLSINPKMAALFGAGATHIEVEQRHSLSGDLSKWLQGYVLSHKSNPQSPHSICLEKIQDLCGSTATIRKFRQQLRAAMNELKEQRIVLGWKLENDVLKLWR